MNIRTRALAVVLLVCFALPAMVAVAAPASAHPFGPPSTARISVDGSHVAISWMAAEDDWVALGASVGAFENPATGAVSTQLTGEQKLERSPAVHDYLLARITVSQRGRPCEGRLEPLQGLLAQGARFSFECGEPVAEVDVTMSALVDLNANYRTMLTAATPAMPTRTLFTAAATTRQLRFSASAGGMPADVTGLAAGLAVAVLAGAGGFVVLRVRRARKNA
ncbi:hypothetical protein Pth03_33360 [Planotetraspora thailandica]|uniref:Gram-positive cocci surface proteins LPxTG domain-containing protein n=1 Tax=Planotetraspora thailandica TaxID=487172 RepID=A0A8J3V0B6_9ACTN|nr:hypothetical protein [Planotetraspora thailandica]GII54947.1 hypothetical protein Pth03_33360 [Planotetraspora thailandica]